MTGHPHGSRPRSLIGSVGPIEIAIPRAVLNTADGQTTQEPVAVSLAASHADRRRADRQLLPGRRPTRAICAGCSALCSVSVR